MGFLCFCVYRQCERADATCCVHGVLQRRRQRAHGPAGGLHALGGAQTVIPMPFFRFFFFRICIDGDVNCFISLCICMIDIHHCVCRGAASGDADASFAFCAHPFVLDPAIKSRILHVDAMIEMQKQAEVRPDSVSVFSLRAVFPSSFLSIW